MDTSASEVDTQISKYVFVVLCFSLLCSCEPDMSLALQTILLKLLLQQASFPMAYLLKLSLKVFFLSTNSIYL